MDSFYFSYQENKAKRLLKNSFWISIVLHLLLLLSAVAFLFVHPEEEQKPPHYYVPAYTYKGAITPSPSQHKVVAQKTEQSLPTPKPMQAPMQKPIQSPITRPVHATSKHGIYPKSMLAASLNMLKQEQLKAVAESQKEAEPIYLVGDESQSADPLIKMLGRALSANFSYPKQAGMFGIHGKVLVEMTLHPEGYLSDIRIVHSSSNQDLDAAALYAVNNAPTIYGVDRFLDKPKHFVIGFIFYLR